MPEGPEVTRLTRQLNIKYGNSVLTGIEPISGRYTKNPIPGIDNFQTPTRVHSIKNKGKFIYWHMERASFPCFLFSTLGMTGSYTVEATKYDRIKFTFANLPTLYYSDMRNFGTMKFVIEQDELTKKLNSIGPDMLNKPCSIEEWLKICEKRKNNTLVKFLMEQKNISGVGNIYKSESLYLAKLNPARLIKDCSEGELIGLYVAVTTVLHRAYRMGGSTIATYSDLENKIGEYTKAQISKEELEKIRSRTKFNHAQQIEEPLSGVMVYNQRLDPFGNNVEKLKLNDDRTTFWVPAVQT